MKIQIDGTNSQNKGAELMLVAILQEIEKAYPKSKVYYNSNSSSNPDFIPIETDLEIQTRKLFFNARINFYVVALLNKLNLPFSRFTSKRVVQEVKIVLDGGGFQFSDQWKYSDKTLDQWEEYFRKLKNGGAKIVFLPQALGPFNTKNGKRSVEIINKYGDIIIAREEVSYDYVTKAGASKDKVWCYPDFSISVKGIFPESCLRIKDKVCVIPNMKMITHSNGSSDEYFKFLEDAINLIESKGKEAFLLNHEGQKDLELCNKINERFDNRLDVITGLNGLEIKGVIGASYAVVSSRFHGVASALNQGVPCLATGWNHKYEMLLKDFGQDTMMVDLSQSQESLRKLSDILDESVNNQIRMDLQKHKGDLLNRISEMWGKIWDKIK